MDPKPAIHGESSLLNPKKNITLDANKDSKYNQRSVSALTSLKRFFYSLGKRIASFFVSLRNRIIGKVQDVTPQTKSSEIDTIEKQLREKDNLTSQLETEVKIQNLKIEKLLSQLKQSEEKNKVLESSDSIEKKQEYSTKQLEDKLKLKESELLDIQKLINEEEMHKKNLELKLKENKKTIANLKKELSRFNKELSSSQNIIKPNKLKSRQQYEIKETYIKLNKVVTNLEGQVNLIKSLEEQLSEKKKQSENLTKKLSTEMSSKVSSSESNLENISVLNRPMMISEKYSKCVCDEWLKAMTFLNEDVSTNTLSQQEKFMVLETIIRLSYDAALNHLNMIFIQFLTAYGIKIDGKILSGKTNKETYICLTQAIKNKYLASHNEFLDSHRLRGVQYKEIGSIIDACKDSIKSHFSGQKTYNDLISTEVIENYIIETTKVMWTLVIQRPPMELTTPKDLEEASLDKFYDKYWNSVGDPTHFQVINPALYHDTQLMAKGRVYLYKKSAD